LPVFFHTGSALGIRPSKRSPLERCPSVSARTDPPAVLPTGSAGAEAPTRPGWPRLLGFAPFESPLRSERVFSTPIRRMLPWAFLPSRASNSSLARDPSRAPLSRFAEPLKRTPRPAPQSINRLLPGLTRSRRQAGRMGKTTLLGFPHRSVPEHTGASPLGLCVHLVPRRTSLPTADTL
jgi:hypothetical protein